MIAHHVFPQQFKNQFAKIFESVNLSIHHPMFGAWVEKATHQSYKWHRAYNDAWALFFDKFPNPTVDQTLLFAMELANHFGFKLNF